MVTRVFFAGGNSLPRRKNALLTCKRQVFATNRFFHLAMRRTFVRGSRFPAPRNTRLSRRHARTSEKSARLGRGNRLPPGKNER